MAKITITENCCRVILENQLFELKNREIDAAEFERFEKENRKRIEATEQALKDYDTVCQARDALGGPKILGPEGIDLDKLKGGG